MHGQSRGQIHDQPKRREILHGVVVDLCAHGRIDLKGRGHERCGVTVGRRLRGHVDADQAARTRPIIHDDGLPEHFAHLGLQQPKQNVAVASGRRRIDHAHELRWKCLRKCSMRAHGERDADERDCKRFRHHGLSRCIVRARRRHLKRRAWPAFGSGRSHARRHKFGIADDSITRITRRRIAACNASFAL